MGRFQKEIATGKHTSLIVPNVDGKKNYFSIELFPGINNNVM
jgi:hypothetical protein